MAKTKPDHRREQAAQIPMPKDFSPPRALQVFKRLLRQTQLNLAVEKQSLRFYDRIFTPVVTLWYMIFQRLAPDHTLQAAVLDLHAGGADRLSPRHRPALSKRIQSRATTAFSKARERLPLALFHDVLRAQARDVWKLSQQTGLWRGLRVLLLDGSQISLRPHPNVLARLEPSANQNGKAYWVLMRVVATFCLHSGIVVGSAHASTSVSEQALACQLILPCLAGCLYLGDRNFGIFQLVQRVRHANAHGLFRLTLSRARRLAGGERRLRRCGDYPLCWTPSRNDLRHPGCDPLPVNGRLIIAQYRRPGFRSRWIYLFCTLTDAQSYSAAALLELYAFRWQVELDLRYLKTQMNLDRLDCKSADMAEKEWLAGLMAYNLVRVLMLTAALNQTIQPTVLSFSTTRRLLFLWLRPGLSWGRIAHSWEELILSVTTVRQPSRTKPKPAEPRAKRHRRETFPPLRGSRAVARRNLRRSSVKC